MKSIPHRTLPLLAMGALLLAGCGDNPPPDEAMAAGKTKADFPPATADVFDGMDAGVKLTPAEAEGRNTWMLWTGGNERLWNQMAQEGYGLIDFLYVLDSRKRADRFKRLGLINEPGHASNAQPDSHGLYLDKTLPAGEQPGIDPKIYGTSTGVVGLRLFPNPEFDEKAKKHWDAKKFYEDVDYRTDPKLVRPYRVGMTCAICHVAPHPGTPPPDPENPEWKHLSGTIGNQYFRNGEVFGFNLKDDDFLRQIMKAVLPGTVDTSIVATDYNNNPNIINGLFNTAERLAIAKNETVDGNALLLDPKTAERPVPHVLVDGADTIGVTGALARVFVNIGTYSEEWLRCHNAILGFKHQKPMSIKTAFDKSVYWQATVDQCANLAAYLVKAGQRIPLADVPGGQAYLTEPPAVVDRGKIVFAENCFPCHSSKQPADGKERPIADVAKWSKDPDYLAWARTEVMKPDFLDQNYLSIDERIPVTITKTNAARALQDNARTNHVWADFSSVDYKTTPSVGSIDVADPFTDKPWSFPMLGNGPGFYRVPSLVAIWSSAPFLHNNALGKHTHDPSVAGRMEAFDDAIRKMCWPEKRDGKASVVVAQEPCYFRLDGRYLPVLLKGVLGKGISPFLDYPWLAGTPILLGGLFLTFRARKAKPKTLRRWLRAGGGIIVMLLAVAILAGNHFAAGKLGGVEIGPIPKGFPLNLLVNIDPELTKPTEVAAAFAKFHSDLGEIKKRNLDDKAAMELIGKNSGPALLAVNKAPDFIRDRGHYFPSNLPDEDKEALIAWLKRL
ncbi:MAG: hypothetical protein ACKO2G_12015 [Verrucomicrobiales bacterium]